MTEVGGTYSMKYKMTTTMIIIVVVIPCPSSSSWSLIVILVPHCCPGPSLLVCIACVCLWVLAVICGLWWAVVCFLGVAAVFVCWPLFMFIFRGLLSFLGGCEWSSLMVVRWCRRGGRAVIGRHWGHRWCGGSGGGGGG